MTISAAVMSSARTGTGRDDWCTPSVVLDRVRGIAPIVLDPCTNGMNPTGAQIFFVGEYDDGLSEDWHTFTFRPELIYVNAPYSQMAKWAAKAADEAKGGARIVMLVPARTDTAWWRAATSEADAVAFWRGRITFVGAPHPAPFPSAIIAYNIGHRALKRAFGDVADVWCVP